MIYDCFTNACEGKHLNILEILIEHTKTYPHIILFYGYNQKLYGLQYGVSSGNIDIINIVLDCTHVGANNSMMWLHAAYGACQAGRIDLFKTYTEYSEQHYIHNYGKFPEVYLQYACMSDNNIDMVNYLINTRSTNNYNYALQAACKHGCIKMAELMIKYGANNFDEGICAACRGGHIKLIEFMLTKDVELSQENLRTACEHNQTEVIDFLIKRGCNDWSKGLKGACYGDNINTVKLMIANGAINFTECIHHTPYCYDLDVLKLLVSSSIGVIDWNHVLYCACIDWDMDIQIIEYILDNGATNLNESLKTTHTHRVDTVNILIRYGANDFTLLNDAVDFKLHRLYLKHTGVPRGDRYYKYLATYPPCVLFVGCKLTKVKVKVVDVDVCHVKRLPIELFKVLDTF